MLFIFFEDFEFFSNLVSFPVAITNPIILLWDILQPAQTVFSNVIGSGLDSLLLSKYLILALNSSKENYFVSISISHSQGKN